MEIQNFLVPEKWGAKSLLDPRRGDYSLAKRNSAAFRKMFADLVGAYGKERKTATVFLSGWYPICEQLDIVKLHVHILGHSPTFAGSGFRWFGPTDPTQSMMYLRDAEFSCINRVGFVGPNEGKLLSAIRLACIRKDGNVQRRIRIQDVIINDPIGAHEHRNPRSFSAGVLGGGPGYTNWNNDFFIFDNLLVHSCDAAMQVDGDQAVGWQIDNFGSSQCDYMYLSTHGGHFEGNNWYPSKDTWKSVIHCSADIGRKLRFNLTGFHTEHLRANAMISSTAQLHGTIAGSMIQFSGLDEYRTAWLIDLQNHCRCHVTFRDLSIGRSTYLGKVLPKLGLRLGPHETSRVEYTVGFDNVMGAEAVELYQQNLGGPHHRTVKIVTDAGVKHAGRQSQHFTPIGNLA